MYTGLAGNRALLEEANSTVAFPHAAAAAEARRGPDAQRALNARIMRATQGLQAPLRLAMEERILKSMTPRLPGLYCHHPLAAQINGTLDTIDFCDILNSPEDAETVGLPHLLTERQLGIL